MATLLPADKDERAGRGGSVHLAVVQTIGAWVLGGRYRPGESLPREDALAEEIGVSRTSIREAVKVLCAKGLLEARPRVGVRVRERAHWRLTDPIVLAWHPDLAREPELIENLIEARRIIEPAAAELAARRGTEEDLRAMETAYLAMERTILHDLMACCEADVAFHRALVAAGHNAVLTSLIGTVAAALRISFLTTTSLMESEAKALSAHKMVLEKVRAHDTAAARAALDRLLDLAAEDYHRGR